MSRCKTKGNLLLLEHEPGRKLLKVVQKRTSRLATMGVILGGVHYFFPEEGVWLMEAGQASIVFNGYPFSIQQGQHLLAASEVSFAKYFVYSYLKRAGYVVLPSSRKNEKVICEEKARAAKHSSRGLSSQKFPQKLLDQFPSVSRTDYDVCDLHKQEVFAEKFAVSSCFPNRAHSTFSFTPRFDGTLRPRYWPDFNEASKSSRSWLEYRVALQNLKTASRSRGFLKNSSGLKRQRQTSISNAQRELPSQVELHELSSRVCRGKLVLAVVYHSTALFYDTSHRSIQL